MDRSFRTAKRLLKGTAGCKFSVETTTFVSAALISTRSVAFFAAIKFNANGTFDVTLTTAKSPACAVRTAKTCACPYRAVGHVMHAVLALTDNNGVVNFEGHIARLVITPGRAAVQHAVENAVLYAAEACDTTLRLKEMAPLSFLLTARHAKPNTGIYLELQHVQFVVAPVDGAGDTMTVGYSPEESVNTSTYKWTLTAATEWTECQLCLQLSKAMTADLNRNPPPLPWFKALF